MEESIGGMLFFCMVMFKGDRALRMDQRPRGKDEPPISLLIYPGSPPGNARWIDFSRSFVIKAPHLESPFDSSSWSVEDYSSPFSNSIFIYSLEAMGHFFNELESFFFEAESVIGKLHIIISLWIKYSLLSTAF